MKSFQPLYSRILISPFPEEKEEKLKSGIIVPDAAKDGRIGRGVVLETGAGRPQDDCSECIPLQVKVGDKVMYTKGRAFEFRIQAQDMVLMDEADILGIYEDVEDDS